jgi:alpha-L-fucosidase 2
VATVLTFPLCGAHPCPSSAASQSLDPATGALDVDYSSYLSQHDVVFRVPVDGPAQGLTVGNGRVGAMVWNQNGLNLQISGVDASEETAFSAGLIRLETRPPLNSARFRFEQRLSLYDGTLITRYDAGRVVTVMGAPDSELMGIHVEDKSGGTSPTQLDLGIWDVSRLEGGDVPDIVTWRTVTTFADPTAIGLSRGQEDPNNFGYTLAVTVQGAGFTTQSVDASHVRLTIKPSKNYTIWIACASRLNAAGHDSVSQAHALLVGAAAGGYRPILARYTSWWHAFWHRSFVQYSTGAPDGDYLENLYYLYSYIIAAGSYGNYPFHFINGDFAALGDANSKKWSSGYWHWNERDVYSSFLASNHAEILHGLNRLYSRNFAELTEHTRSRYLVGGIWVPETIGWDGNARHTEDSDYTKDILSTSGEVAESLYSEYAYTNDVAYLKSTVYPFVKAVADFYANKLARDPDTGEYHMASSNADETYWDVRDAITDLAAIRSILPIAIRTSLELDADGDARSRWSSILEHLAPYPRSDDGSSYAPHDPPKSKNRNGQNVSSELIWPFGLTGLGSPDYALAQSTWARREHPYGDIWSNDAIQAARLGLGDEVLRGMKRMIGTYQTYPNGLTNDANGRFEYLGTHLSAINESLLQSYDDEIRAFPALPSASGTSGRFTLLARGGFLVSSEYAAGQVAYISVKSLYGNRVALVNPWRRERVQVRRLADGAKIMIASGDVLSFDTQPNTVYVVERPAMPLACFRHLRLTGKTNDTAKRLAETPAVLGVSTGGALGNPSE